MKNNKMENLISEVPDMKVTSEVINKRMEHLRELFQCSIHKKENILIFNSNIILEFKNKTEVNNFLYNLIKLEKNGVVKSEFK